MTADRADEVFLETERARLRMWRVDEADRFLDTTDRYCGTDMQLFRLLPPLPGAAAGTD